MQQVQLYIDGKRVELFKDETINLTQTIKNVQDFSKIFIWVFKVSRLVSSSLAI